MVTGMTGGDGGPSGKILLVDISNQAAPAWP